MTVAFIGYYTITPTHCGTGQAAGAVDLPIARETHTQHPIFPATSIKGALRQRFQDDGVSRDHVKLWFGAELPSESTQDSTAEESTKSADERTPSAGSITFGEGRLLAFPVRALHTAFCYVTCPLILERFERDLHAYGLASFWPSELSSRGSESPWDVAEAIVGPGSCSSQPLILEDLVFDSQSDQVTSSPSVETLGAVLGQLLPGKEKATRRRLSAQLVVLSDELFEDLVRRTTSVQARIRLNETKTTTGGGGNLWYEENLPPDTLLGSFISVRKQTTNGAAKPASAERPDFFEQLEALTQKPLQIGGNETVGQGICLWTRGATAHG